MASPSARLLSRGQRQARIESRSLDYTGYAVGFLTHGTDADVVAWCEAPPISFQIVWDCWDLSISS